MPGRHLSAPGRGGSGGAGRCGLPAWKAPGSGLGSSLKPGVICTATPQLGRRRLASCPRPEPVAAESRPARALCAQGLWGIARRAASCVSVQSLVHPVRARCLLSAMSLAGSARSSLLACPGGSLAEPITVPFRGWPGKSRVARERGRGGRMHAGVRDLLHLHGGIGEHPDRTGQIAEVRTERAASRLQRGAPAWAHGHHPITMPR